MALPALTPTPVSSNWVTAHANAKTADNSGNAVTDPDGLATANHRLLSLPRGSTVLQVRMRYTDAATVTTPPTIQVFGYDEAGIGCALGIAAGTHENAMSDAVTDYSDGSFERTVGVDILTKGVRYAMVAIKVAANFTGAASIEARAY